MRLVPFLFFLMVLLTLIFSTANGLFEYREFKSIVVHAPAVSSRGEGVISKITLAIAYPGRGRVFFSALPYTEVETQGAARIAAYVASVIAGVRFSNYDFYVLVESDTPLIGGPSAGALISVGFASMLLNLTLSNAISMTGTVNPDGTIGPVGSLKEKLEAAANSGFKVFLIPRGQRLYTYPVYTELRRGWIVVRQVTYRTIDLVEYGKSLGVDVFEVSDIAEALYYFTGFEIKAVEPSRLVEDGIRNLSRQYFHMVSEIIRYYTSRATARAQTLSSYYRGYFMSAIRAVNSSHERYASLVDPYSAYASYRVLDLLEQSARLYYALVDHAIAREDAIQILNSATSRVHQLSSNTCGLELSIARGLIYVAWLYYTYAENSTDSNPTIMYLSKAVRLAFESELYVTLSDAGLTRLTCRQSIYTDIYSHALAVHTYVSKLLEEAGTGKSFFDAASAYTIALNSAYRELDQAVYGLSIYVLAYSTLALHDILGSFQLVNYRRLISIYPMNEDSPVARYLILATSEAYNLGDLDAGSTILLLYVFAAQVQANAWDDSQPAPTESLSTVEKTVTTGVLDSNAGSQIHVDKDSRETRAIQEGEKPPIPKWRVVLVTIAILATGVVLLTLAYKEQVADKTPPVHILMVLLS